jgi:MFS family permease
MAMLIAGTGLSNLMNAPWQLFLTWGLMVGIGSGAGAIGMAAAVANRWFAKRNGLAMGLLTAANAAGQLIFLPLLDAGAALWVAGSGCCSDTGRARDVAGRRHVAAGMAGEYRSWPLRRRCLPEPDKASEQSVRSGDGGAFPSLAFI